MNIQQGMVTEDRGQPVNWEHTISTQTAARHHKRRTEKGKGESSGQPVGEHEGGWVGRQGSSCRVTGCRPGLRASMKLGNQSHFKYCHSSDSTVWQRKHVPFLLRWEGG